MHICQADSAHISNTMSITYIKHNEYIKYVAIKESLDTYMQQKDLSTYIQ